MVSFAKRFILVVLLMGSICSCKAANKFPGIENTGANPNTDFSEFYQQDEGTIYTSENFDLKIYPVELVAFDEKLYFSYEMVVLNKCKLAYHDLNLYAEFNEALYPYLNGPNYLGEVFFDGEKSSLIHYIDTQKQINPAGMQREYGITEDAFVLKPEDVGILQGIPADAVMYIESGKNKWEIPITFVYQADPA